MALADKKINKYKVNITELPDYPSDAGITPEQLKAIFDGRSDNEIKNAINGIIDELTSEGAAGQILCSDGESVASKIEKNRVSASNAQIDARQAKETSEENKSDISELKNWRHGADEIVLKGQSGGYDADIKLKFDDMRLSLSGTFYHGPDDMGPEEVIDFKGAIIPDLHNYPQADLVTATELSPLQKENIRKNIGMTEQIQKIEEKLDNQNAEETTDSKYFEIDLDGLLSLNPDYSDELPKKIVLPSIIEETTVTGLKDGLFRDNLQVEEIVLPDTITEIPANFCRGAWNLRSIKNTENITVVRQHAFNRTKIDKIMLPKLKEIETLALRGCVLLHTVDIGDITAIPDKLFYGDTHLSCVLGGHNVKTIGASAFYATYRLKNLSFLPQVTSIGDYAFDYCSRVLFEWDLIKNTCTFGSYAKPTDGFTDTGYKSFKKFEGTKNEYLALTSTDENYYSFIPCENPIPDVLLNQVNPEWADKPIGDSTEIFGNGCSFFTLLNIHSGYTGNTYTDPQKLIDEIRDQEAKTGKRVLNLTPVNRNNIVQYFDILGYSAPITTGYGKDNLKAIYKAIAEGAYVFISQESAASAASGGGHAVCLYGVNEIGEFLVADSEAMMGQLGGIYVGDKYQVAIQNMVASAESFNIVTKK